MSQENIELYQTILGVIVVSALVTAIIAFFRTPPTKRWTSSQPVPGIKYAPMYTRKERIRIVVKHSLWVVPLVLLLKFSFFPWLSQFAKNANCYNFGPVNGMHVLFYGIFVGLPLIMAVSFYFLDGVNAVKAFKYSQYPPANQKVFQLTPYKYGSSAKLHASIIFAGIAACIGFSIWGGFQAQKITEEIKPCAISSAIEDTDQRR